MHGIEALQGGSTAIACMRASLGRSREQEAAQTGCSRSVQWYPPPPHQALPRVQLGAACCDRMLLLHMDPPCGQRSAQGRAPAMLGHVCVSTGAAAHAVAVACLTLFARTCGRRLNHATNPACDCASRVSSGASLASSTMVGWLAVLADHPPSASSSAVHYKVRGIMLSCVRYQRGAGSPCSRCRRDQRAV